MEIFARPFWLVKFCFRTLVQFYKDVFYIMEGSSNFYVQCHVVSVHLYLSIMLYSHNTINRAGNSVTGYHAVSWDIMVDYHTSSGILGYHAISQIIMSTIF